MSNPFEDEQADYRVLVNEENQHSLWPGFVDVPAGWTTVFGPAGRQDCLEFVEREWVDMRPASLIARMGA
ncbi:MbtH family protein [Actinophytocola sp.]|uniref:MbtH family protein n=1 Tax=Actinophytocola sp. TaxID=1872138 RepID=UPI002EDAD469